MFKKILSAIFVVILLVPNMGQAFAESIYSVESVNDTNLMVQSEDYGSNMRIMVEKENEKYYYGLNNSIEKVPVQLGNGLYTVKILKNLEGNRYQVVKDMDLNIHNSDLDVFLSSSQPVYWENQHKLTGLRDILMEGLTTDRQKIEAAYNYLVNNVKYDYNKINGLSTDYVPNIGNTITTKKGICYDYAALFAGILRAQGIHTKLVKGYKSDIQAYHAWNEVLVDGSWIVIDTTYDAALSGYSDVSMVKSGDDYNKIREY